MKTTGFESSSTILATVLQSGSAICDLPYLLRIVLLLIFLLLMMLMNPWRGWTNQIFKPHPDLLSPSNLLMLFGAGLCAFWSLHEPCPGPRFSFFLGVATIVLARVIRRWEYDAEGK
jgi:hypothetical protein